MELISTFCRASVICPLPVFRGTPKYWQFAEALREAGPGREESNASVSGRLPPGCC